MANDDFPIDTAQMVANFMESVFYGILLVSFIMCLRTLLWPEGCFKPLRFLNPRLKMLAATILMFTIATLDLGFHLRRNLEAFVWSHGPAAEDFKDTSRWTSVITMGTYIAQTLVGDSILLYRCWVIYNHNWLVIAIPVVFWLGISVCGVITIRLGATIDMHDKFINMERIVPFVTSILCLTLAISVLTTSLIVYRFWKIRSSIGNQLFIASFPLTHMLVVFIESGAIYSLSMVILCGVYMASSKAEYPVSNAVVQIIGITFNLIIIRLPRNSESGSRLPVHHRPLQHQLHQIDIQTTTKHQVDTEHEQYHIEDGRNPA